MPMDGADAVVRFVLDGHRYELTRSEVESRLTGVRPELVKTHAVRVNGTWYPVRQAFEVGTGIPRALFISHTARRHLANLGLEIRGEIQHRDEPVSLAPIHNPPAEPAIRPSPAGSGPWHTEVNVQAAVVKALESNGWQILSQADTATKERGIDVVASRQGQVVGIEVKGFPTKTYADPRRQDEVKPTQPSTQAGHWYSQAVLAAMRLRTRHSDYVSVIALPDFPRYRTLHVETERSLDAAGIRVWWVESTGIVEGFQTLQG